MTARATTSGDAVRAMMRTRLVASLATTLAKPGAALGWPYASLVLVAAGYDAAPLLLISRLAEHTRNIGADDRVSLLFDSTDEATDRLAGARVTVVGRARKLDDERALVRFVSRHPESAGYATFADFALYGVSIDSAHLVGGFGRIEWIDGAAIRFDAAGSDPLAAAERSLVDQMNSDGTALKLAETMGLHGAWQATGVDPEGIDVRCEQRAARLAFAAPARTPEAAVAEIQQAIQAERLAGGRDRGRV